MTKPISLFTACRPVFGALWRPVLFCFLLIFASKSANWDSPHIMSWPLPCFLLMSLFLIRLPAWLRFLGWLDWLWVRMDRRFMLWICGAGLAASLVTCYFILDPIPHVVDDYAYLYQAKIFASGRLFAQDTGLPAFDMPWMIKRDGRFFGLFPPGWPLLLAGGAALKAPALVNPALGCLAYWVIFLLFREMAGRERAKLGVLFCLLSPFYLFLSASFLSHSSLLLFSALGALCFVKGMNGRGLKWFAFSGLSCGCCFLIRPAEGVVFALAMSAYWLCKQRLRATPAIALVLIGLAIGAAAYLIHGRLVTGEWFVSSYSLADAGQKNFAARYGFGSKIGAPEWEDNFDKPGHKPWRSVINLNFNLAILSTDLFGWPGVSLLFALLFLVFGRKQWYHHFSLFIIGGLILLYAGYWYHGVCFGARFYYGMLPYLALLTVSGIVELPRMARDHLPGLDAGHDGRFSEASAPWRNYLFTLIILFFAYGAFIYMPLVSLGKPYHNFCEFNDEVGRFARRQNIHNAIVFIHPGGEAALPGLIRNKVDIAQSDVIFASDMGKAENQKIIQRFPGREVFYFKQKTRPGALSHQMFQWYLRSLWDRSATSVNRPKQEKYP